MDTGEVKISKSGSNGMQHMTYQRKVADFNTFIKSPELFTKGSTVSTNDKVSSKPGDKDYKQLQGGKYVKVNENMGVEIMNILQAINDASGTISVEGETVSGLFAALCTLIPAGLLAPAAVKVVKDVIADMKGQDKVESFIKDAEKEVQAQGQAVPAVAQDNAEYNKAQGAQPQK